PGENLILEESLNPLNGPGWQLTLPLHFGEIRCLDSPQFEPLPKHIRCHDCVLDGVVNPDSPNRGHDMGRIANEQQARTKPVGKTRRLDGEHGNLLPLLQLIYPVCQLRHGLCQTLAQRFQPGCTNQLIASFSDGIADLPVIKAINHGNDAPSSDATNKGSSLILLLQRKAEPEDIQWRGSRDGFKPHQASQA